MPGKDVLKKSRQIPMYITPEFLKKIDAFWHKYSHANRNQAMLYLLEQGLEKVKEGRTNNK